MPGRSRAESSRAARAHAHYGRKVGEGKGEGARALDLSKSQ